jgi:uncharacterized Zn finger protein
MCKHLAAVMYGVGNRLDFSPELLFVLRGVDHLELIEQAIPSAPVGSGCDAPTIATDNLGDIFDIEIDEAPTALEEVKVTKSTTKTSESPAVKKVTKKLSKVKKAQVLNKEATRVPRARVAKKG